MLTRGQTQANLSGFTALALSPTDSPVFWTCGFIILWFTVVYIMASLHHRWITYTTPSSKPHENNKYWATLIVMSGIHSIVVVVCVLPCLVLLMQVPNEVRFICSSDTSFCRVDPDRLPENFRHHAWVFQAIPFVSLICLAWLTMDIFVSTYHGLLTPDFLCHHVAFLLAGGLARMHCLAPFMVAVILSVEITTPLLNVVVFFRHRETNVPIAFFAFAFALLFFVFRICLLPFGVLQFLQSSKVMLPSSVSWLEAHLLSLALVAGVGLQYYWFPKILLTMVAKLTGKNEATGPEY